jgi:hypothetical protein
MVFIAVAPVLMTGLLGNDRGAVADQVGYLLDGDAVVAHDRDERGVARGPVLPNVAVPMTRQTDCSVASAGLEIGHLSVGWTGQCWDNALAESFFSSLKGELIDTRAWPTRAGARRAVVEYIGWYNGTPLHSSLGYQSPADYENSHREQVRQVA